MKVMLWLYFVILYVIIAHIYILLKRHVTQGTLNTNLMYLFENLMFFLARRTLSMHADVVGYTVIEDVEGIHVAVTITIDTHDLTCFF